MNFSEATMALFGLGLETGINEVDALLRHAALADREGLDLVSLSDHPYFEDRLDAYSALGFVLGRTTNLTGVVNVTNLPSRPAPMLARTIAGLSVMSGGRVALGMGAGGLWDDMAKLGISRLSPAASIRALEEGITVVRALFGGGAPVFFDGEFYQVAGLVPSPVPVPPIWLGSLGPKSLAVTGRVGDGWIPGHAADWKSTRVAESRPLIDEAAAAVGRAPSDIATLYNIPGRITTSPLPQTRDRNGRWLGGTPQQWIEEFTAAVLDHGAGGFIFFPVADGTPIDTSISRWAQEIAPAVREATKQSRVPAKPANAS